MSSSFRLDVEIISTISARVNRHACAVYRVSKFSLGQSKQSVNKKASIREMDRGLKLLSYDGRPARPGDPHPIQKLSEPDLITVDGIPEARTDNPPQNAGDREVTKGEAQEERHRASIQDEPASANYH